jgi:DNA-directed RNA polymerase subunit K/omega
MITKKVYFNQLAYMASNIVKTNTPVSHSSLVTRDIDKIAAPTGNVYESVAVVAKRARQISVKMKEELNSKLAEFASSVDNLEEVFENREQIEISRYYEKLPKATSVATDEFLSGKLMHRRGDTEEATNA